MDKHEIIKTFLTDRGYDLKEIKGFNNSSDKVIKALNKQEALEALHLYRELKIPVLGGDVFYLNKDKDIDWTLDNWHFEKTKDESDEEFLNRGIDGSIIYIQNYNNNNFNECQFLFDIVYNINILQ